MLELTRGDKATILVSDLLDGDGNPATFGTGDVLRFTVKRDTKSLDNRALISRSSDDGSITYVAGTGTATIVIKGTDWSAISVPVNTSIVWDLQLSVGGSADEIFTLAEGQGRIVADVTLTAP